MIKNALLGAVAGLMLMASPLAMAGDKATDFTLRNLSGEAVTLSDHTGKVVILSFWATWCGPCKEEMPHLQKLYTEKKEEGLVLLSISTDDARSASKVKPYIKSKGYDFTVLLDRESTVISTYNPAKTMPYTVVIDKNGHVAQVTSGYNPGDEEALGALVTKLLEG
ncbi:MAG: redoxin domain-containing protein [Rhodobacterales bacterium]|nr:redoxin domain-containing protein [Rhodobacterales bacterium]